MQPCAKQAPLSSPAATLRKGKNKTKKTSARQAKLKEREATVDQMARREILEHGLRYKLPSWLHKRRLPSLLLLADSQLENWPGRDKICTLEFRKGWTLRWTQAIKTGEIRINCYTVVLYLEDTRHWNDVPPIKNALHALCKAIKNHAPDPRVFIANHLPRVTSSPVTLPVANSNFTLQQATRSVGHALGAIHEMSLYEHFISKRGKVLKPTQKYFIQEGMLTPLGCLIFRECVLCEAGIKNYWFTKREGPDRSSQ